MVVLKVIREEISSSLRFYTFFVSFATQKKRFIDECCHFVGIDDCHLKDHFRGVILSTVSIDVNSWIFPLTICVCKVKNSDT